MKKEIISLMVVCSMTAAGSVSAHDWSGLYAGGQLGYGTISAGMPYGDVGGPYDTFQANAVGDGYILGGHVGYNWQSGTFVYGAEFGLNGSSLKGDDHRDGGDVNGVEVNYEVALRTNVGIAANRFLYYGTAGFSLMNADATAPGSSKSTNYLGLTIGFGAAWALNNNLRLRAEYLYTAYGAEDVDFPSSGYGERIKPRTNVVQVGASYRF